MKAFFYSIPDPNGLCASYMRAATHLQLEHRFFDYVASQQKHMPLGIFGYKLQQYILIELLHQKVNRDFVIQVKDYKPNLIFFFTNAPVSPGALLFIRSILPQCKLILVWPDPLTSFTQNTFNNLQLFDFIASYSAAAVDILQAVTKGIVSFIPLAGDPDIHVMTPLSHSQADIGFVGSWRPERQRTMETIDKHFGHLNIEIWGPYWREKCKTSKLKKFIKGTGLHGKEMAEFINTTKVNLNTIDDTNYPAANMRFFEIMVSGGLELVSACPEMEPYFIDKTDVLYFHDEGSLVEKVNWIFSNEDKLLMIKNNAQKKILADHNYTQRLADILKQIA